MAASSKKAVLAALIGNSLIAVTKFIAAFLTFSSAMLAEGIHSVVDSGNQILLLYGLKRAKKPPDKLHPFGYGKESFFWGFIVAILLFAAGSGLSIYEGIHGIMSPHPVKNPGINYVVLGFAFLFESGSLYYALKEFLKEKGKKSFFEAIERSKRPSLFVVLFEDTAALSGILIAFLGIFLGQITGIDRFDGFASLAIGFILAGTAMWLAWKTKRLLIGEGAHIEVVESIREKAENYAEIKTVNEILTLQMGPDNLLVNISVDFRENIEAGKVENVIQELTKKIKARHSSVERVFVEAEKTEVAESQK